MRNINIAIIGTSDESLSAYRVLNEIGQVKIKAVSTEEGKLLNYLKQQDQEQLIWNDPIELATQSGIDLLLVDSNSNDIEIIRENKNQQASVVELKDGNLLMILVETSQELLGVKKIKGELSAILSSVQEAIEVADVNGLIKYVNPSFTRVTGISEDLRVGKNIFDVSPHGALAQCLVRQKAVVGYRSEVGGSGVEVISNAAPIVVDGEIDGAVVVFQPITDILKLMDELQKSTTIIENLYARIDSIIGPKYNFEDFKGHSKIFEATLDLAKKSSKSDSPILIMGEIGTGKEACAQAIHQASSRRGKPFINLKCGSVHEDLLELELFGCEKGAYAGAIRAKLGKIELANEGTILLEDVGNLKPYFQEKLLSYLQNKKFLRVGGEVQISSDVRIISTTNIDIKSLVRRGKFIEELYYSINAIELNIPSLRQRREDVPMLAEQMIKKLNNKLGKNVKEISPETLEMMANYEWPGNLKELQHVTERAMALAEGQVLEKEHLSPYITQFSNQRTGHYMEIMPLDKMEQMMLKSAMARYGESLEGKKKAAQVLNISLATLYNKLKKYKSNF